MPAELRFGVSSVVSYQPRGDVAQWSGPRGEPLADVRAATAAAIAAPLDFPPLRQAVVPGDRVVLAVESGVPQAAAIVAALVEAVLEGGASPEDITLLQEEDDRAFCDLRSDLHARYRDSMRLATHHPDSRGDLSYLGADEQGRPIYMSRHLLDADVVVPIERIRLDDSLEYGGVHATLYPTFADHEARQRCQVGRNGQSRAGSRLRRSRSNSSRAPSATRRNAATTQREADQIAWLLGVMFAVQVVPGGGDHVLHVLAGRTETVLERGRQLARQAWLFDVPRRADLVVAAIEGNIAQQTWHNVGRAVAAAQRVVNENGVIALCTEIAAAPPPGVRAAASAESLDQAQRRLNKQKPPDLPAAQQWAQALDRNRVYLLSQLDADEVEQLGAAYVASADEVGRLIDRTDSCIVLPNAQYVLPAAALD